MDSKCRAEARDLVDTLIHGLKAGIIRTISLPETGYCVPWTWQEWLCGEPGDDQLRYVCGVMRMVGIGAELYDAGNDELRHLWWGLHIRKKRMVTK